MIRRLVAIGATSLLVTTCTQGDEPQPSRTASVSPPPVVEVKTGPTTAIQAMRRLCIPADIPKGPVTRVPTPPTIAEAENQVEAVRGLVFQRRVNVEPVTPEEIDRRLR